MTGWDGMAWHGMEWNGSWGGRRGFSARSPYRSSLVVDLLLLESFALSLPLLPPFGELTTEFTQVVRRHPRSAGVEGPACSLSLARCRCRPDRARVLQELKTGRLGDCSIA